MHHPVHAKEIGWRWNRPTREMFDYTVRALDDGDIPEGSEYTSDIPRGVAASESQISQG